MDIYDYVTERCQWAEVSFDSCNYTLERSTIIYFQITINTGLHGVLSTW